MFVDPRCTEDARVQVAVQVPHPSTSPSSAEPSAHRLPASPSNPRSSASASSYASTYFVFLVGIQCEWGIAYTITKEEDKQVALEYLEVRVKQYDEKIYLDLYTDSPPKIPAVENVMVYLATTNKESNQNYLGPAPLEELARQIYLAVGPSGPNKEYLFKLEDALNKLGVVDTHVQELANAVREYSDTELSK